MRLAWSFDVHVRCQSVPHNQADAGVDCDSQLRSSGGKPVRESVSGRRKEEKFTWSFWVPPELSWRPASALACRRKERYGTSRLSSAAARGTLRALNAQHQNLRFRLQ